MRKLTLLPILALLLCSCTPYRVTHNLAYGAGARQTYDLYTPRVGAAPTPVLLVVHGGGYVGGDKAWGRKVADKYCLAGFTVVSINYTLANAAGNEWPAQLRDAALALDVIRRSPRINAGPVTGFGISAGAHLVAALHLQGGLERAVAISGPYDLLNWSNPTMDGSVRALLGKPRGAPITTLERRNLSPRSWVHGGANMLLIHSTGDSLAPVEAALGMEQEIIANSGRVSVELVRGDHHASAWSDAVPQTLRWLLGL